MISNVTPKVGVHEGCSTPSASAGGKGLYSCGEVPNPAVNIELANASISALAFGADSALKSMRSTYALDFALATRATIDPLPV